MGRPKVALTPEQLKERSERYWGKERNEARKKRYAENEEFRKKTIQHVKKMYRIKKAVPLSIRAGQCMENLGNVETFGVTRFIVDDKHLGKRKDLTFSIEEFAEVINRNHHVVMRWIYSDMFPKPIHIAVDKGKLIKVYSLTETNALGLILAEHEKFSLYYTRKHTDIRDKLFAVFDYTKRDKNVSRQIGVPNEL